MWLLIIVAVLAAADTFQSAPPRAPYEQHACPFECCTYGAWTATSRVSIRRDRRANAPVVFQVASGERVDAVTGVVITTRLGTARAKADGTMFESGVPIKKGATVSVLHYTGEGTWKIWVNGIADSWEIDESTEEPFSYQTLRMVTPPATTWWVQIRNGKGQVGWTTRVDDFKGKDLCGCS